MKEIDYWKVEVDMNKGLWVWVWVHYRSYQVKHMYLNKENIYSVKV